MKTIDYKAYFHAAYQGAADFNANILEPLFGKNEISNDYNDYAPDEDKTSILSLHRCGKYSLKVGDPIYFFDVTIADDCIIERRLRIDVKKIIVKYMEIFSGAFIVFHYTDTTKNPTWRLSWVEKQKGNSDTTSLKRYNYLCGSNYFCRTIAERFAELSSKSPITLTNITEAFSVEALTKEFYGKLYNWYLWAVEPSTGVTFPNLVSTSEDDRDNIAIKIIRLITRLLFVWFIKQKNLVPDALFDENELTKILANFDPQADKDGKYYNAILQNLFFATLNNEVGDRKFISAPYMGRSGSYGVKHLFRDSKNASWFKISQEEVLKRFHDVPFLNCGLFECLDKYAKSDIGQEEDMFLDGFSSRDARLNGHFKYRAFIPNILFFASEEDWREVTVEENGKLKKDRVKAMGLIPLLKQYNFTVQENTPSEVDVSLDPELLGKVFENLLAAYNPETKKSARESTGSFYTPRPIVEYMVNESLIEYLKTKVPSVTDKNWRALISYDDVPYSISENERIATLNALYECKTLDPACGSGAFPMGMLQQMVHVMSKLNPNLNPYDTKLHIINNCIYGSDIQPIAMLISKLRFFISLICEQDDTVNFDDEENNFGINTLPNLETKFVAANSLLTADIHTYADDDWTLDKKLIKLKNELLKIRQDHFSVRTQKSKLKKREEDEKKRQEIQDYLLLSTPRPENKLVKMAERRIEELKLERKFFEAEKFVEENAPTQMNLFSDVKKHAERKDVNKVKRDSIDAEIKKLQNFIKKQKEADNLVGFNAAIKQIADWNPYNQLIHAPFFDAEWMFGIKDGFDIVIGNPPYFQVPKGIYSATQFPYSEGKDTGKQNMYKLFVEHSYNCTKENGIACMIVQSSLMCDMSSKYTRELLLRHTCLEQMIEFPKTAPTPAGQVFASVCQGTCIYLLRKAEPDHQAFMVSVNNDCTTLSTMQKEMILQDALIEFYPEDYAIPLLNKDEFKVLKKIKDNSIKLNDIIIEVAQGDMNLTTSKNEIMSNKTSVKLLRGCHVSSYYTDYEAVDEYIRRGFKQDNVRLNNSIQYIVCQEVSGTVDPRRIHAALTNTSESFLCGHTINKIRLQETKLNCYVLGLLNSTLMDWVFRKTSSNNHVGGYELKQLPIIMAEDRKPIEEIVKVIIATKEQNPNANTSKLESQLDNEVYALYGIEGKNRELIEKNYV